jgi:hypothetical protein
MKKDLMELNEVEQHNFERMLDAVLAARGLPHDWLVTRLRKGRTDFLQLTDDQYKKYKWIFSITPGASLAVPHMGFTWRPQRYASASAMEMFACCSELKIWWWSVICHQFDVPMIPNEASRQSPNRFASDSFFTSWDRGRRSWESITSSSDVNVCV